MGVPKFYRWMSERYPCLSEIVKEHQIPEFDNLYLDMNGIIHNCSHPNDEDPHFRITEEKIFADIFHYIEFLFQMIKPQKVFFMAVDGVAPRAKMNQQRGRRFRTARDSDLLRKQALERGEILPSEQHFDSNCITPGTEFMAKLNDQLKYFVTLKISTDRSWQQCKVYLSGHETPGEGEHKIMDFIRYHKAQPGYNPNTRHCLYGLDADLMMLGLCSHEPFFSLLREEVKFGRKNQKRDATPEQITFHLLHLSLMRGYISHEFQNLKTRLTFPFDLEKVIDDWVLMGFLVGNDFIPNIPGLHINKNALPNLYSAYIEVLPTLDGYINEAGFLNLKRFQVYLKRLAQMDLEQFKEVSGDFKYLESKMSKPSQQFSNYGTSLDELVTDDFEEMDSDYSDETTNMEFKQHKRDYYITKMDYENVTKETLEEQATEYVRAIQWNLHYYYNGIVSWSWYYPHHYAPYISDVTDFSELKLEFELGHPFLPFQQLLGVLPEASKSLLPVPYQRLMTSEESPLRKFYPMDFKTDQNGKQNEWEAVVLIPFIDENLLVSCMEQVNDQLTPEEKFRNKHGPHLLYSYTEETLKPYHSSLPNLFPDIIFNHARLEEVNKDFFFLHYKMLKKGLCEGVNLEYYTPGFPTLSHLSHTAELKKSHVMVFQTPVRNESMILTLKDRPMDDLQDLSDLLGKVVYVGWPHLAEAKVDAVSDGCWKIRLNEENSSTRSALTKPEKDIWKRRGNSVQERYAVRWGITTGPIDFLVESSIMNGRRFVCGAGGKVTLEKQWSKQITPFALQAVVQDLPTNTVEKLHFETVEDLFPPGLQCFHLGNPYYGCMGIVQEKTVNSTSKGCVAVQFEVQADINFSQLKKRESQMLQNKYLPGYQIAQRLGISSHLLSRFTGTYLVQTNLRESMNPIRSNIGLNLKFNKKNEEVPGYSKKGADGTWVYSLKALDVMSEYLEKFPDLFDNVSVNLNKDYVHVDDLFPNGKGKAVIQDVLTWLKGLPCSSQQRTACGATMLDPLVVEEVIKIVENLKWDKPKPCPVTMVEAQVLYRPLPLAYTSVPDKSTTYALFDRVVNVREGYSVPLGLRGTVMGLSSPAINGSEKPESEELYDIVFDEEFVGGVALNCTSTRGYRLPPSALINLSHGIRMFGGNRSATEVDSPQRKQNKTSNNCNNSYAKVLQPAKSVNPARSQQSQNGRGKGFNGPRSENVMVRLEHSGGGKLRRRVSQESSPTNTHHFNHSPHSPFVPHLLFQGGPKVVPSKNSDPWENNQFVTPKAPVSQSNRRTNQEPVQAPPRQSGGASGGSEDEFTCIWGELKQANNLSNSGPPNPPVFPPENSAPAGFAKKVSIEEMLQQAKAAEEAVREHAIIQPPIPVHRSAVMELMQLVNSTFGELPVYKYRSWGPTPLYGADLHLPDGRTFTSSKFEPSQELASENVAEQAMLALRNISLPAASSNIRPTLPPPFKSGCFNPTSPYMGRDLSLSAAALVLPMVPPTTHPPLGINPLSNIVRGPPPPAIYNIPQSFLAQNQLETSHWEQLNFQKQRPSRQQPLHKTPTQQIYQPPPAQQKRDAASLNTNAIEFVPTQVARKQAGGKPAAKEENLHYVEKARQEVQKLSLGQQTPANSTVGSPGVNTQSNLLASTSQNLASSLTPTPQETTGPRRKTKSRLAVKFNKQPN